MHLNDFDYDLPTELIAQAPANPRDHSRLLVYDKKTGTLITANFGGILPPDRQMLTLLLQKKFPEAFPEKQEISLAASAGIGVNIRVVE
jgi:hypothetical protein